GKTCSISAPINGNGLNNVVIAGPSLTSSSNHDYGSAKCSASISASSGFSGVAMVTFNQASGGDTVTALDGDGLVGLCLLGNGYVAAGLQIASLRNGLFKNLYLENFTEVYINVAVAPMFNGGVALAEACD